MIEIASLAQNPSSFIRQAVAVIASPHNLAAETLEDLSVGQPVGATAPGGPRAATEHKKMEV
jgi:hypothetical protein